MRRTLITILLTVALVAPASVAVATYHATNPHQEAANWAVDNGLIQGTEDEQLKLNDPATRGQVLTILYRYHHNCHTYNRQGNCDYKH